MTENKLSYTELKKRTEAPQEILFKASRLPAKNTCIGGYTWEFPPNTIDTDIRLAYPVENRPYWSLWTKDFCGSVDFVDGESAGELRSVLPAELDDEENDIILYLLMEFIGGPNNYFCTYNDISCNGFDISILYAAALSMDRDSDDYPLIGKYLKPSKKKYKKKIIDAAFPEFRDRVSRRLDEILID